MIVTTVPTVLNQMKQAPVVGPVGGEVGFYGKGWAWADLNKFAMRCGFIRDACISKNGLVHIRRLHPFERIVLAYRLDFPLLDAIDRKLV
jgi:hypothetical protein